MQKFMFMAMVKLESKPRTVKIDRTRVLPGKRKEPVRAGSNQNK